MVLENKEKHPSYGMVEFSRVSSSGKQRLFGSSIDRHYHTIMLRVHHGCVSHDLNRDYHFQDGQIVEVELSSAQFAELLTTMNMGQGIPCTIRWLKGEGRIEDPPARPLEIQKVRQDFADKVAELTDRFTDRMEEIKKRMEKKAVNKSDREFVVGAMEEIIREVKHNLPFTLNQFEEASEKVVTSAKAEIDNFVTAVAAQTGLERLREMHSENAGLLSERTVAAEIDDED